MFKLTNYILEQGDFEDLIYHLQCATQWYHKTRVHIRPHDIDKCEVVGTMGPALDTAPRHIPDHHAGHLSCALPWFSGQYPWVISVTVFSLPNLTTAIFIMRVQLLFVYNVVWLATGFMSHNVSCVLKLWNT